MLVKTFAAALHSIDALTVTIEVNITRGCYLSLVGLPDAAVRESLDRIRSTFDTLGITFPQKSVTINLSPADLKKEGTAYDLPIALALMAADGVFAGDALPRYMIMGELSLDGSLRPIKGALPIAIQARAAGFEGLILPMDNAREAAVVNNLAVYGVQHISEVISHFNGSGVLTPTVVDTRKEFYDRQQQIPFDFSEVKGQEKVKRALEVAAAGGHNLIMVGSPGSGKSMMAKRMPGILPPFTLSESLETTKIYSVAGKLGLNAMLLTQRPFRSPHHSISSAALVGGGTYPQPGEISLAHNGVLFLDELAEFNRSVLEVMRQPLEDRHITVSRAKMTVDYPAGFMLVAAMNPCPCGYYNHPTRPCTCPPGQVEKYLSRISGPLLDRIDIQVEITPVPFEKISDERPAESSDAIRSRVIAAREIQSRRFADHAGVHCNAQMDDKLMNRYALPDEQGLHRLRVAMERFDLSARAYGRILKVARTIADLAGSADVCADHIAEAIGYRNLDRSNWGKV
ncbi:YifB family Mg chelatase-like AAA ATPase [Porphyromonas loveana]|uniref:YifB family Mg chelatase-like AAA ATPase n=1 Tax=Porphyromonas loveana TaxID=1884669 RepID=UPI0035A15464